MLEVLRYIALNALNTVQKIKAMSKMSKIDKVHLMAVMLCMSKMSKIDQIHLRAVMLCMSKMSKIDQINLRAVMLCMSKMGKEHTHTFWLITSLILMDFQSEKSFGKLRLRAFQPYHQILCMLKHVEDVKTEYRNVIINSFLHTERIQKVKAWLVYGQT